MIDRAMVLSVVFDLDRPWDLSPRAISTDRSLLLWKNFGSKPNATLVDDVLLLNEPRGVPERVCTMRMLSLLSRLTETSRAFSGRFTLLGVDHISSSIVILNAERCAGSWWNSGNAVNMFLSLLRPLEEA
jgi:hypothetical protein